MNLDEFLQSPAAVSLPAAGDTSPGSGEVSTDTQSASSEVASQPREDTAPEQPGVLPGGAGVSAPEGEPQQITALTPSGIEVLYQWAPKRLYRVRHTQIVGLSKEVEVPSVTTVLGVLDKPGLPWWGMKMGVEGSLELAKRGLLRYASDIDGLAVPGKGMTGSTLLPADVDNVVELLTEFKLTVNHKRDQAGDRGNNVHDAFEAWAMRDVWPHPEIYPENERGYVAGLVRFLEDCAIEPGGAEIMVGSVEHGFAGRYDLRAIIGGSDLVTKTYPKRADKVERIEGSFLLDLKTSKGVYATHQIQLEAYEGASIECGYSPTEGRAVIRVTADGRYEFVRSKATFGDFLAVKSAHDALDSLSRRRK